MTVKERLDAILKDSDTQKWSRLAEKAKVSAVLLRQAYHRNTTMPEDVAEGLHSNLGYDLKWLLFGEGELKKAPIDKQTKIIDEKFSSKDDNHNLGVINQTPNDLKDMLTRALKDIGRLEHEIDLIKRELEALKSPKKVKESGEGGVIGDKDVV